MSRWLQVEPRKLCQYSWSLCRDVLCVEKDHTMNDLQRNILCSAVRQKRAALRKVTKAPVYVTSVLDPPLNIKCYPYFVGFAFPSSLAWSSCSLLTAFHATKSLSDKQGEHRTSLQVSLCIVTSLQTCLSPQRELFSPHPFTLCISKTDMQHSITVFSQACLSLFLYPSLLYSLKPFLPKRAERSEAKRLECKIILYLYMTFRFMEYNLIVTSPFVFHSFKYSISITNTNINFQNTPSTLLYLL